MGDDIVGSFDLTKNINLKDPELLKTFRDILERRATGSLRARGASNKIKEEIGERQALDRLSRRFPGAVEAVVAKRANGVPILDAVLRKPDGGFVIVESKFSSAGHATLGRTNNRMWLPTKNGWKEVILRRDTVQMSPKWIQDRLIELRETGDKIARRLAGELEHALREGRVNAFVITTDSTGEVLNVADRTTELQKAYMQPGTKVPTGGASAVEAGAERATAAGTRAAGAAEATVLEAGEEVGERAVSGRIASSLAVEEGETLARGTSLVAREAVEVATRETALKGAVSVVGRVLVAGLVRVLAILDVIGWLLLAVDLVSFIWDHYKERAIKQAVEQGLKTNIPAEIMKGLEQSKNEIARYYARSWLNKHTKGPVFLYLSPRLVVEGGYGNDGFAYTARAPAKVIENDLVSTTLLKPARRETYDGGTSYQEIEIRWSMANPIFTPFEIYLAFTEFFVEHLVDSWTMNYVDRVKMSPKVVSDFHRAVEFLAEMSATLKYEPWFGWVPSDQAISQRRAAIERWEALQRLSKQIEKELVPRVAELEKQNLVNPKTVRWDALTSPLRSELDPLGEDSLAPSMRTIAVDMRYFDSKYLEYERFETLHAREKAKTAGTSVLLSFMGGSIEAQKQVDLREFLKPVQKYLPKSLVPPEPWYDLTGITTGNLVISP
ncbi:MAG: hypothetical protein ACJ757_12790 [Gaiellaceae bacterium]